MKIPWKFLRYSGCTEKNMQVSMLTAAPERAALLFFSLHLPQTSVKLVT
jgi:hypothetical protein